MNEEKQNNLATFLMICFVVLIYVQMAVSSSQTNKHNLGNNAQSQLSGSSSTTNDGSNKATTTKPAVNRTHSEDDDSRLEIED